MSVIWTRGTRREGELMSRFAALLCLVLSCGFFSCVHAAGQPCEQLAQLALPNTKITSAQTIAAGALSPPPPGTPRVIGCPSFYKQLPALCRVTARAETTPPYDINTATLSA